MTEPTGPTFSEYARLWALHSFAANIAHFEVINRGGITADVAIDIYERGFLSTADDYLEKAIEAYEENSLPATLRPMRKAMRDAGLQDVQMIRFLAQIEGYRSVAGVVSRESLLGDAPADENLYSMQYQIEEQILQEGPVNSQEWGEVMRLLTGSRDHSTTLDASQSL